MISTMGSSTASSHLATTQLSRLHPYQPAALSAVVNLNSLSQQVPPSFTRNDRRALASLGMGPSAPSGSAKQKYNSRRLVPSYRTNVETDLRMGGNVEVDPRGILGSSFVEGRILDSHPNSGLKRRTLSATGLKTLQDYPQGSSARLNSRFVTAGSATDLSGSGGNSPYAPAQQYMCSMYAFPNVLKVVPQQTNAPMNLSVISGPAPVTYRPDPTIVSAHVDSTAGQPHRLSTTTPAQLLRWDRCTLLL